MATLSVHKAVNFIILILMIASRVSSQGQETHPQNECKSPTLPLCETGCQGNKWYLSTVNGTSSCKPCPDCGRGFRLDGLCGGRQGSNAKCEPVCKPGSTFFDADDSRCKPCRVCDNTIGDLQCNATDDTVCGPCKPKYYQSLNWPGMCHPCKFHQRPDLEPQCQDEEKPRTTEPPNTSARPLVTESSLIGDHQTTTQDSHGRVVSTPGYETEIPPPQEDEPLAFSEESYDQEIERADDNPQTSSMSTLQTFAPFFAVLLTMIIATGCYVARKVRSEKIHSGRLTRLPDKDGIYIPMEFLSAVSPPDPLNEGLVIDPAKGKAYNTVQQPTRTDSELGTEPLQGETTQLGGKSGGEEEEPLLNDHPTLVTVEVHENGEGLGAISGADAALSTGCISTNGGGTVGCCKPDVGAGARAAAMPAAYENTAVEPEATVCKDFGTQTEIQLDVAGTGAVGACAGADAAVVGAGAAAVGAGPAVIRKPAAATAGSSAAVQPEATVCFHHAGAGAGTRAACSAAAVGAGPAGPAVIRKPATAALEPEATVCINCETQTDFLLDSAGAGAGSAGADVGCSSAARKPAIAALEPEAMVGIHGETQTNSLLDSAGAVQNAAPAAVGKPVEPEATVCMRSKVQTELLPDATAAKEINFCRTAAGKLVQQESSRSKPSETQPLLEGLAAAAATESEILREDHGNGQHTTFDRNTNQDSSCNGKKDEQHNSPHISLSLTGSHNEVVINYLVNKAFSCRDTGEG